MKKGFSITITNQEIEINSFISNEYDNFYLKTETFDILFEGVLLNKKKLLNEFASKDLETIIIELYVQRKEKIITYFEGEYRGFIFDKIQNKFSVFTNITSTQRVFYTKFEGKIFVDTSLIRLNEHLKKIGIKTEPDIGALYQLLCFSNLLEQNTPIQNIFKLLDGHFLEIDSKNLKLKEIRYFSLTDTSEFKGSKSAAIDLIHEVFTDAVLMEYEKDTELGKKHLALLSGGLDSRVAFFYALKNDQKPSTALCFSQSNYYDHLISKKITEDYKIPYEYVPLDSGKFLNEIDKLTEISEGMVFYTGGIHVDYAVENMKYDNFALFHSGQIGDVTLGGFNTEPRRKKPSYFKIVEFPKLLPKVKYSLDEVIKNYETEELFLYRNVSFNRIILGAQAFQQKRYQTSPFMTKDFMNCAVSLPEDWKYNHRFYLDWVKKHCEEASKYKWERTLMKPDANWKTTFGDKVLKRGFKIINERILKTSYNSSMYPYQYYYDTEKGIQKYYQKYFDENFGRISDYKELQKDVIDLFSSKSFHTKTKAINILAIFKLYF